MIDLSKLSSKELRQLEKEIEEQKKTRKDFDSWKITFILRYDPNKNPSLTSEKYGDVHIEDIMLYEVANLFVKYFNLSEPEGVSGCYIVPATGEEIN